MRTALDEFILRCSRPGLILDASIALLYCIGRLDRNLISNFKRTIAFAPEDFDTLIRVVRAFNAIATTPNILSEVCNFAGQLSEPRRTEFFHRFTDLLVPQQEHYISTANAAAVPSFPRIELTDATVHRLCEQGFGALTVDRRLVAELETSGLPVLNFNHIRLFGW